MKLVLVITVLLIARVTGKDAGDGDQSPRRRSQTITKAGSSTNYNIKGVKTRKLTTAAEQWNYHANTLNKVSLPSSELTDAQTSFSDMPSDLPSTQPSGQGGVLGLDLVGRSSKSKSSKDSEDIILIPIPIPIYIPNGNRTDIDDLFCPLGINILFQCCLTWDPENCRCQFGTPMDGMEICCELGAGGCGCDYGIGTDGRCCLPSEECYCPFGENQQGECCETWDPEMCRCPFGVLPEEGAEECCEADGEGCTYTPTFFPTITPRPTISTQPSAVPSPMPSAHPSTYPSLLPSSEPSGMPSVSPSKRPSTSPSSDPSGMPSGSPSSAPSTSPSDTPSSQPSLSALPSTSPSTTPSLSSSPSHQPSEMPSVSPSATPSSSPSDQPSEHPSVSQSPSKRPSKEPTQSPSVSARPTDSPMTPQSCEEAMVYCGGVNVTNLDRMAWCRENELPARWGFTNRVGTNKTCIIGASKSGCDVTKGYDAGSLEIDQGKKMFIVNLNPGVVIAEYHISTTLGFQSVGASFERYPKSGGVVQDGDRIVLDPDSPFGNDDWFTFQVEVCQDNPEGPSARKRPKRDP